MSIYKEPPPGMCIVPDSDDLTKVIKCFLKHLRDTVHVRAVSHLAKLNAKVKKIKEQEKESKEKNQTSKKIFAFARCEWALKLIFLKLQFGKKLFLSCKILRNNYRFTL